MTDGQFPCGDTSVNRDLSLPKRDHKHPAIRASIQGFGIIRIESERMDIGYRTHRYLGPRREHWGFADRSPALRRNCPGASEPNSRHYPCSGTIPCRSTHTVRRSPADRWRVRRHPRPLVESQASTSLRLRLCSAKRSPLAGIRACHLVAEVPRRGYSCFVDRLSPDRVCHIGSDPTTLCSRVASSLPNPCSCRVFRGNLHMKSRSSKDRWQAEIRGSAHPSFGLH